MIILPVGPVNQVMLVVGGWGGTVGGLDTVDGRKANQNSSTVRQKPLEIGQRYTVRVSVLLRGEQASVEVTLNGERHVSWRGPVASLSVVRDWVLPRSDVLGLGTNSSALFRSVKLRMLSGEAELLP